MIFSCYFVEMLWSPEVHSGFLDIDGCTSAHRVSLF